jgi:D-alanyl-D-alanine dipeptidase
MMLKIQFNIKYFHLIFLILPALIYKSSAAQELKVVNTFEEYRMLVQKDSLQKMVELKSQLPLLLYDLRYATKNNFTGKKLYPKGDKTFVRLLLAKALQEVQKELLAAGYGLKVWDAYRPYAVTKKMWKLIGDERYVANPAKGSGHNRGLAVDVTLVDLVSKKELNLGTAYDSFTDTAHHSFKALPEDVLSHRELLKKTMEKYGFKALETEWWHYSFQNNNNYEVLDIPFRKLSKNR